MGFIVCSHVEIYPALKYIWNKTKTFGIWEEESADVGVTRDELNFILGTRTLTQRLTTRKPIHWEFQTIMANVISIKEASWGIMIHREDYELFKKLLNNFFFVDRRLVILKTHLAKRTWMSASALSVSRKFNIEFFDHTDKASCRILRVWPASRDDIVWFTRL